MKTLAELELESTEGFKNPPITDSELHKKIQAARVKSESESGGLMTQDDYAQESLDDDNEDEDGDEA